MRPHTCPTCNGAGTVSRPPHIAGDIYEWAAYDMGPYPCKSCNGSGILWEADAPPIEGSPTQRGEE